MPLIEVEFKESHTMVGESWRLTFLAHAEKLVEVKPPQCSCWKPRFGCALPRDAPKGYYNLLGDMYLVVNSDSEWKYLPLSFRCKQNKVTWPSFPSASGPMQMSRRIHLSFQSECKRSTIFLVYNNQVNFLDKCHRTDFQFQIFCLVRNQNHHKINSVQCLKWTATIRPLRNVPMKF